MQPAHPDQAQPARRLGNDAKDQIRRAALDLFISRGYEGTSVRDIAAELGITASALYYHFRNKEEIATSLVRTRQDELRALADWVSAQPRTPDLPRRTVLRWIDHVTPDQLQAMRFAQSNQPFMRQYGRGGPIRDGFDRVIDALAGDDATPAERLRLHMLFDTVAAALRASQYIQVPDEQVLAEARRAAIALTEPAG
jgi:AcrR family transcriptional regulator